jgi:hypothetical protein
MFISAFHHYFQSAFEQSKSDVVKRQKPEAHQDMLLDFSSFGGTQLLDL